MTNNFNTNSNGPDIEFSGFMDGDKSRMDFDENFETIVHQSYSKTSIQFYNPGGEITQSLDIKVKALKKDLYKFVDENVNAVIDQACSKQALYDETIAFLQDEIAAYKYDLDEMSNAYGITISFVNDIEILVTKGYSQGDYALVIVDRTQLTELWGKYTDNVQECIDHYFWDSPVWAKLEINGTEYQYYEFDLKEYEWEKEAFIKHVAKASGILQSELESLVPSELSYV